MFGPEPEGGGGIGSIQMTTAIMMALGPRVWISKCSPSNDTIYYKQTIS